MSSQYARPANVTFLHEGSRLASAVETRPITWLMPGYLAEGTVVVVDGDPGLGKTTLLCELAARVSRGAALPNGRRRAPAGVVLLMGEDTDETTTVPRLAAAGADLDRILLRNTYGAESWPAFPTDTLLLQQDVRAMGAKLVVIDPIMGYLAEDINSSSDPQVRRALMPLKLLAEAEGCTIVLIRHLNKMAGANSLYRGNGSMGFVGVARTALVMARHPDDPDVRVLAVNKTNLSAMPPAIGFRLADAGTGVARVEWLGTTELTAEQLIGTAPPERRATLRELARDFLREQLAGGLVPVTDLKERAEEQGLSWPTVRLAQADLAIRPRKQPDGWYWRLPEEDANAPQGAGTFSTFSTFITLNTLEDDQGDKDDQGAKVLEAHPPLAPCPAPARTFPVVAATGRYDCANHCGRTKYLPKGARQLCDVCAGQYALLQPEMLPPGRDDPPPAD